MTSQDQDSTASRRWGRRRQLVPVVVGLCTSLVLLRILLAGDFEYHPKVAPGVSCERGWPWGFVWQEEKAGRTSFTQGIEEFRPWTLAMNGGVALSIVGATVLLAAAWVRRVRTFRQFRISSALLGLLLAALTLGWWRSYVNQWEEEQPLITAIRRFHGDVITHYVGPRWLRKLLGTNPFASMEQVVQCWIGVYNWETA